MGTRRPQHGKFIVRETEVLSGGTHSFVDNSVVWMSLNTNSNV